MVHEGKAGAGQGTYRVHVHRKARARGRRLAGGLWGWARPAGRPLRAGARPACACQQQPPSSPHPRTACCALHPHPSFAHSQVEGQWYEVQDLRVTEVLPQMVALSETYLQVYELKPEGAQ